MPQLIVVSSLREISPFLEKHCHSEDKAIEQLIEISDKLSVLISGIGVPSLTYNLTRVLCEKKFESVVQVGIAGSYRTSFPPVTLVEISEDAFADVGIDDRGRFLSLKEAGLVDPGKSQFEGERLINRDAGKTGLPLARAITANTVSGSDRIIEQRKMIFDPDIESMEGAAAFYVCFNLKVPVIQVRSVSNMVEPRDKSKWKTIEAITDLNNWIESFVNI
jgi:futalosine hydrolase